METSRLAILLRKTIDQTVTPTEREELFGLLADLDNKRFAERFLSAAWKDFHHTENVFSPQESTELLARIMASHPALENEEPGLRRLPLVRYWMAIAATVVVVASLALYFFRLSDINDASPTSLADAVRQAEIEPGKGRAIITLGDGRTVLLDESGKGLLAEAAGVQIQKLADGEISYAAAAQHDEAPVEQHTITIPRGGHYQLVLPDGSKVHLNAESTLKYPTHFAANERIVELEGEAFFEVEKSASRPFKVVSNGQVVEVLGTKFNVCAYDGSDIRTTLAEGSVRVSSNGGSSELLKPGEVAVLTKGSDKFEVSEVNLNMELAWHNGYFLFEDESITSIMDRIARWYDIEVEYQGDLAEKRFGGVFRRSKNLAQLLESFQETGLIEFTITERRVIVMAR